VCVTHLSEKSGRQRVKEIQLRNCIVHSVGSGSVKHCVQDRCEGGETVGVQSYLLRVILEIIVSVQFSLIMVLFMSCK
jgi:hypothetical protein